MTTTLSATGTGLTGPAKVVPDGDTIHPGKNCVARGQGWYRRKDLTGKPQD
jgi:hypothetical protein